MTKSNQQQYLIGLMEVAFSDEYFQLAKNNWNIQLVSKEMTLLRVYDSTHELCFVTRYDEDKLSYFLLFGTYEHQDSQIIHTTDSWKKISESSFKGKSQDEIFEIIRKLFGERKCHALIEGGEIHE
ncbi:hypothetical protein [Enterococcus wangshanyuanii]|uniref:Uncharacterized protein n=1 Tax=Enterococcus wangshanyuanii TaxID=2005703 RepID=A0ABQ1PUS5_9ENTE|nr:hypothetical protein [Enterococcus wangshanyuanii]GGD04337.1 hypothetical protein GCM10011573_37350 [Enterococcus wangshanyuanii]